MPDRRADLSHLAVSERRAARMFDMTPTEFRGLVDNGDLPAARDIGGYKRWDVEELRSILSGGAADGMGDVRW